MADPTKVVCGSYHTKFAEGHMGIAKCPHGVCVYVLWWVCCPTPCGSVSISCNRTLGPTANGKVQLRVAAMSTRQTIILGSCSV